MRKLFIFIFFIFLGLPTSCQLLPKTFSITEPNVINISIGESIALPYQGNLEETIWENSNPEVIFQDGLKIEGLSVGISVIKAIYQGNIKEYYFIVNDKIINFIIEGKQNILIDEEAQLKATISPLQINQNVLWSSSDITIATVNEEGLVVGKKEGLAMITATSMHDQTESKKFPIIVYDNYQLPEDGDIITRILTESNTINSTNFMNLLMPLIKTSQDAIIGVNNYLLTTSGSSLQQSGSGVIYRRDVVLKDDTVVKDCEDISVYSNIKEFRYYVMTNRHVVKDAEDLTIFYNNEGIEVKANLLQYDPKIDFAIINFTSKLYFPLARLGNSDNIETGEFVYTIGHPSSKTTSYFQSISLGIISYTKRYVSDDTDGDGLADWHSEYIQHDAAINPGNSGGGLFNLKGEIIGINTTKIIDSKVDNMGFSVPINLAILISPLLEEGIQPQRARLDITVIDVKAIIRSPASFPDIYIPYGITKGLYVKEVTAGGLGAISGLQEKDIIISFDGIEINETYMFRIILVRHSLGSGDIVPMIINRRGQNITIYVTF